MWEIGFDLVLRGHKDGASSAWKAVMFGRKERLDRDLRTSRHRGHDFSIW